MNKYVIIHGQLRELPEDELMHWKYIKREKVNGKWKYYYDLGETQKKAYEQAKNAYDTRKAQAQSAYKKKLPVAGGMKSDGNVAAARYYNSDSHHKSASYDKLKKNLDETKAAYDKTPLAKREARAEKTKQNVNKVKNWAKDKLGYDEKQAMETAKVNAAVKRREADDTAIKNNEWKTNNPNSENIHYMANWQNEFQYQLAAEAWGKAKEATEKYEKTPLAKIEKAGAKINSAKELVHELVTNERGKKARKAWEDANNDLSNALAKEDYHRKKYEEVLSKTRKQEYFDKDHGNTAMVNEWKKDADEARAESKAALERVKEAREAYESTPMGKRERREYEKNKRKKR